MARPHLTQPVLTAQQIANFWAKVDRRGPDECWPWTGALLRGGYGKASFRIPPKKNPTTFGAHVVARWLATGEWHTGLCTLHTCDNPPCCNHAHLWIGTYADNAQDRERKGRGKPPCLKGEDCGRAKLTEAQVIEIRRLYATGFIPIVELGRMYGVHAVSINLIVNRINWPHLP